MENKPVKWLEKYSWKDLSASVKKIKPKLALLIDELSPSDDYSFYLARYPYGALILDKGVFQLINADGQLVPLHHASIPNETKHELSYNKLMPTGLVSHNSIETFFMTKNRTASSSLYGSGNMVALWHALEGKSSYQAGPIWNISSGARTIYMLPKITDKHSYDALKKKYHLNFTVPQTLNEHWKIFSDLANHSLFPEKWHSEVIFFSRKWFSQAEDKAFSPLFKYFLEEVWSSSSFKRNQFIFDFAFSLAQEKKNLKPNPYLADTVKHLIAMGDGFSPGLATSIDNLSAPISGLQKVFLEDYGLKKYAPALVHLHHFSSDATRPVYYSLETPTTTIFSPRSNRLSSKMVDMRELKYLTETLLSEILKGTLSIEETPLFDIARNVCYKFYHSEKDQLNEISNIADITKIDSSFTKTLIDNKKYAFPEFSPFFRGCISISKGT
ncbi:MAG: hypothetical protein V4496_01565 [Pseudomonadota bacterium]